MRCDIVLPKRKPKLMLKLLADQRAALEELCRRYGVVRLEVFGSATRPDDFNPARSDVDLLVEFVSPSLEYRNFGDLQQALEALLERRVDLVERKAVEESRNHIRRDSILSAAELLYAA